MKIQTHYISPKCETHQFELENPVLSYSKVETPSIGGPGDVEFE